LLAVGWIEEEAQEEENFPIFFFGSKVQQTRLKQDDQPINAAGVGSTY
jgi:hypothetical protein